MQILLDTHAFLWLAINSPQLSAKAQKIFLNSENELFLSSASVWEMAIKFSLGKLSFHKPFESYILEALQSNDIQLLNVNFRHFARVASLPFHHRDPFDRLLISQLLEEKLTLLSCDSLFDLYEIKRIW